MLFLKWDIAILDDIDVGAKNLYRLAALYCGANAGFEIVYGLVDRVMEKNGITFVSPGDKSGYYIERSHEPEFLAGKQARIIYKGKQIRTFGVVNAEIPAPLLNSTLEVSCNDYLRYRAAGPNPKIAAAIRNLEHQTYLFSRFGGGPFRLVADEGKSKCSRVSHGISTILVQDLLYSFEHIRNIPATSRIALNNSLANVTMESNTSRHAWRRQHIWKIHIIIVYLNCKGFTPSGPIGLLPEKRAAVRLPVQKKSSFKLKPGIIEISYESREVEKSAKNKAPTLTAALTDSSDFQFALWGN
ncbi:hypothetical protein OROHE_010139 [Orobanche hederae]